MLVCAGNGGRRRVGNRRRDRRTYRAAVARKRVASGSAVGGGSTAVTVLGAALGHSTLVNKANAGEARVATTSTVSGGLQGASGPRSGSRGGSRGDRAGVSVGAAVTEEGVTASSAVVGLHFRQSEILTLNVRHHLPWFRSSRIGSSSCQKMSQCRSGSCPGYRKFRRWRWCQWERK